MNQTIRILKGPSFYSSSTLLIPDFLLKSFNEKKRKFGSTKILFQFVVNHRHRVYNKKSMSREGKTCYQPENLKLHRKDFYPNNEDWEKFRTYAHLQRISMTFLFVLILMDWEGFTNQKTGVPILPEKIQLIQSLTITEIFTYLEIKHLLL